MQFPATLVWLVEKLPSPSGQRGKKILRLNLFISCNSSKFGSTDRKVSLSSGQRGKNSETESIHFMQFPATLFSWQKRSYPHPAVKQGINSETEYIHFMQFPATLVQLAEKPPPVAKEGKILRLNVSISCNFQKLWFSWQKSYPHPTVTKEGKNSEIESIHFMQFPSNLVQLANPPFSAFS